MLLLEYYVEFIRGGGRVHGRCELPYNKFLILVW